MTAVVLLLACTGFYVGRDASSNGAMLPHALELWKWYNTRMKGNVD